MGQLFLYFLTPILGQIGYFRGIKVTIGRTPIRILYQLIREITLYSYQNGIDTN